VPLIDTRPEQTPERLDQPGGELDLVFGTMRELLNTAADIAMAGRCADPVADRDWVRRP
jgi:hypothetical protein